MPVQFVSVKAQDNDIRLDRWFMRHYPDLKNGQLQRLLRGKNIRVNGQKATTKRERSFNRPRRRKSLSLSADRKPEILFISFSSASLYLALFFLSAFIMGAAI